MTSWFEQGQGESWESGESFESPFAEGAEAWSEVTEAPDARVVGRRVLGGAVGAAFVRAVGRRVRRAVGRDVVAHVHVRPTSRGRVIRGRVIRVWAARGRMGAGDPLVERCAALREERRRMGTVDGRRVTVRGMDR